MSGKDSERITALEVEFKNITIAMSELKVLIKETGLGIREDFARERDANTQRITESNVKIDKQDKRIAVLEKLWQGLFGRLAFVAALGGMFMAIIYEWLKNKFSILP